MLAAILTTIQPPTSAARSLGERMAALGAGGVIVAGDRKGPAAYDLPNTTFLSLQAQLDGPFELARKLPTGHYCRKNIAYLEAIRQGATCIYETDDDNAPLPTWHPRREYLTGLRLVAHEPHESTRTGESAHGAHRGHGTGRWVNVYRYFTDELIWPRGLPLDEIRTSAPALSEVGEQTPEVGRRRSDVGGQGSDAGSQEPEGGVPESGRCSPSGETPAPLTSDIRRPTSAFRAPIQQGLVNGSPDVDAVWRLALDRPFDFDNRSSVYLAPGNWCPFNTQSTWWWPVVYPLLYVPSHCSFRMCDIWKSFVAQRCLWELGHGVVFHAPEVVQDRNPHNLMRDFVDEIPGYQRNRELAQVLDSIDLVPGHAGVVPNLLRCYEALVQKAILPRDELALVRAWIADLNGEAAYATAATIRGDGEGAEA